MCLCYDLACQLLLPVGLEGCTLASLLMLTHIEHAHQLWGNLSLLNCHIGGRRRQQEE